MNKLTLDLRLFIISTPIGNLDDISPRAVDVLKAVDIVACEDTRHSRKLFSHFGISPRRLVSYHEHNEGERAEELVKELKKGRSVALLSDAGAPLLSDPGYRLVRAAAEAGIGVTALPGASAVLAALAVSGLPPVPFTFAGFPPAKSAARREFFAGFSERRDTLVCFESIHRLKDSLADAEAVFGERKMALCRELTKLHEEVLRGTIPEVRRAVEARETLFGEVTLVMAGSDSRVPCHARERTGADSPEEHLRRLLAEGTPPAAAAREAAKAWGAPRQELYRLAVMLKKGGGEAV